MIPEVNQRHQRIYRKKDLHSATFHNFSCVYRKISPGTDRFPLIVSMNTIQIGLYETKSRQRLYKRKIRRNDTAFE